MNTLERQIASIFNNKQFKIAKEGIIDQPIIGPIASITAGTGYLAYSTAKGLFGASNSATVLAGKLYLGASSIGGAILQQPLTWGIIGSKVFSYFMNEAERRRQILADILLKNPELREEWYTETMKAMKPQLDILQKYYIETGGEPYFPTARDIVKEKVIEPGKKIKEKIEMIIGKYGPTVREKTEETLEKVKEGLQQLRERLSKAKSRKEAEAILREYQAQLPAEVKELTYYQKEVRGA
ncbi:MAG: hypothetical protein ACO2O4_05120 [Minisyncoccia bacterium]|jgi:hypothetical protein